MVVGILVALVVAGLEVSAAVHWIPSSALQKTVYKEGLVEYLISLLSSPVSATVDYQWKAKVVIPGGYANFPRILLEYETLEKLTARPQGVESQDIGLDILLEMVLMTADLFGKASSREPKGNPVVLTIAVGLGCKKDVVVELGILCEGFVEAPNFLEAKTAGQVFDLPLMISGEPFQKPYLLAGSQVWVSPVRAADLGLQSAVQWALLGGVHLMKAAASYEAVAVGTVVDAEVLRVGVVVVIAVGSCW